MIEIVTRLETLTPERAAALLAAQHKNRRINIDHVQRLASEIRNGNWRVNGDALKIDSAGILTDGQHRAAAVVETDRSIQTFVAYGVDQDTAQLTVDQGKPRTGAQALDRIGVSNSSMKAAVCRYITLLAEDVKITSAVSNADICAVYAARRETIDMVIVDRIRAPALAVLALSHRAIDLHDVCARLESGAGLENGSPCLALRNWMHSLRGSGTGTPAEIIGKTITAVDALHRRDPIAKLMVSMRRYRRWCVTVGIPVREAWLSALSAVGGKES